MFIKLRPSQLYLSYIEPMSSKIKMKRGKVWLTVANIQYLIFVLLSNILLWLHGDMCFYDSIMVIICYHILSDTSVMQMAEAIRTTVVPIRILIRTTVVPIWILVRTTGM